jgi:hypothetical protein
MTENIKMNMLAVTVTMLATLYLQGCVTVRTEMRAVGSALLQPPPNAAQFSREEFQTVLDVVHSRLEAGGFVRKTPQRKREFPAMETSYGATYQHVSTNLTCSIHATRSGIGVGFKALALSRDAAIVLTDREQKAMNTAINAVRDSVREKYPNVRVEISTMQTSRPK